MVCTFTSANYAVGDVWYPRLGQHGTLHCVACVCQEGGKINCTIQNCSGPECTGSESSVENHCCARCSKVGQDAKLPTSITTPPAPAHSTRVLQENVRVSSFSLSDLSSSSTSSGVTCLHNGNVYRQISN
ncbi:chordin-like protein 2 [Daphnia magna]|nr:chordin-like protein 2 [Daphnia magna]